MNIKNTQPALVPEQRLEQILDLLSTMSFASISDLAASLNVSEMTIRRDLDKLESKGHIRRTHGGVVSESKTQIELDYITRQKRQSQEKDIIGKLASGLVEDGQSVFVDAGTTTLSMAKYLKKFRNIKVITNSLPVQTEFLDNNIEIFLIGGRVLTHTLSLVGTLAQENLSTMRFDWAFLGTGGIDLKRGLTHSTMEEIPIKRAAAASANKVVVLVDSTKFGYNALSQIMPISSVQYIVTDKLPKGIDKDALSKDGVKLIWELPTQSS